jgi:CTP:molybdopterin cytidylyltransferase MocA
MKNTKVSKLNASALILAAGNSQRMGQPKFTLMFDKNITFVEYIISNYQKAGCKSIVAVFNPSGVKLFQKKFPHLCKTVCIVENDYPEWGRFYSIKKGLEKCDRNIPTFIHNVDNPFAEKDLLTNLIINLGHADYSNPIFQGKGGHPIAISPKITQLILLEDNINISLKEYLKQFKKISQEVNDERVTININTQEDYFNVKKFLSL